MKESSWSKASMTQLYAVLHDDESDLIYRQLAAEEIVRRTGRRYALINFKIKPKY